MWQKIKWILAILVLLVAVGALSATVAGGWIVAVGRAIVDILQAIGAATGVGT